MEPMLMERKIARLDELRNLPDGWLDGTGRRSTESALTTAAELLRARPGESRIYPMPCGGVQIESVRGGWDIEVNAEADGGVTLSAVAVEDEGEMEPRRFDALSPEFFEAFDSLVGNLSTN